MLIRIQECRSLRRGRAAVRSQAWYTIVIASALLVLTMVLAVEVQAAGSAPVPAAAAADLSPLASVDRLTLPKLDVAAALAEDQDVESGFPPRFAIASEVTVTPQTHGTWESLPDDDRWLVWRLRIEQSGALSLNFCFTRFRLPKGARLVIYDAQMRQTPREFTPRDNADHGQLWTPVVLSEDVVLELTLPNDPFLDVLRTPAGNRLNLVPGGTFQPSPGCLGQAVGLLHQILHRVDPEDESSPSGVPTIQIPGLREIGVATVKNFLEPGPFT